MKVLLRQDIQHCYECSSLLSYQIGRGPSFKWVCLEMLKDITFPSDVPPGWCPFKEENSGVEKREVME